SDMARPFLPFRIGKALFFIPSFQVREILGRRTVTRIPHATRKLPGVFAHNGVAIPVVDLESVLGVGSAGGNGDGVARDLARVIIARVGDDDLAFGADEVWEIVQVDEAELRQAEVAPSVFASAELQWSDEIA